MARNSQLVRELQLLRLLETSRVGRTLREMATEAGVTTRTIRRDLEALEEAGVPIVDEQAETIGAPRRYRAMDWRKEAA